MQFNGDGVGGGDCGNRRTVIRQFPSGGPGSVDWLLFLLYISMGNSRGISPLSVRVDRPDDCNECDFLHNLSALRDQCSKI